MELKIKRRPVKVASTIHLPVSVRPPSQARPVRSEAKSQSRFQTGEYFSFVFSSTHTRCQEYVRIRLKFLSASSSPECASIFVAVVFRHNIAGVNLLQSATTCPSFCLSPESPF